jgi:prepilin-type N-terminal cleavage/methylation domain-containing protein
MTRLYFPFDEIRISCFNWNMRKDQNHLQLTTHNSQLKLGFTLIEILIVIAILTILFTIALIAINPARQGSQARNTKRRNDVTAILDAVQQYMVDNHGTPPAGITTSALPIQKNGGIDLCANLVTMYLGGLPVDPQTGTGGSVTDCNSNYITNYTIVRTSATDNRIMVSAPAAELSTSISIQR